MTDPAPETVAQALRSPYVPSVVVDLAAASGYLGAVWPAIAASIDTGGFLGSALFMADMALDAVEEVYEPIMTPDDVRAAGLSDADLDQLLAVLDVFHYIQPQLLLICAALAEAWERPTVGGHGRPDPRPVTEREERHRATTILFADPTDGLLPAISEALGVERAPDLYRAAAAWPPYLETAWEELQHLVSYPQFRRRGRGLYFYARSGARFLAEPLSANAKALREAGLNEDAITRARQAVDAALPALAMMMMHTEAMRAGLGIHNREVVET